MQSIKALFVTPLIALLLMMAGCVELVGQRITIYHDQANDTVYVLLHYDGIHDSGKDQFGKGADQVAQAVRQGNFLLLDWPAHVQMNAIRQAAADGAGDSDAEVAFIKAAAASITLRSLGHFRAPDGSMGGVQLITIRHAKQFIARANAALNAYMLRTAGDPDNADASDGDIKLRRTTKRIIAAAKKAHTWIALEGHALKITVPVDPREWAYAKAAFLTKLPNEVKDHADWAKMVQVLTAASLSYNEDDGVVSLRIGATKAPTSLRVQLGRKYEGNLEKAITQNAPVNLDEPIAAALLGDKLDKKYEAAVKAIIQWGPPEEKVRALLHVVAGSDTARRDAALARLKSFAEQWNKTQGLPAAPRPTDDTPAYLEAWRVWYRQMIRFPLPDHVDVIGNDRDENEKGK